MGTLAARVERLRSLAPPDLQAVRALVDAATEADGVHPLSEQAVLDLVSGREGRAWHLLALVPGPGEGETVAGYAHLADGPDGATTDASAEVVVHPLHRRHGAGALLVRELEQLAGRSRVRVWAHGRLPAAAGLAASLGYGVGRELWQMRRSLAQPLPEAPVPDDLTLRTFLPGQDDEAWLATNAAAFAHHPEQGTWTADDLALRKAEPWFDPAGFLLLEDRDGELAGFHWTKVHPADGGHPAAGEVYVVGVAPQFQGRGLGRVLTVAGLEHLRSRGLDEALLYVDADNEAAVRTYSRLGFTPHTVDVQFMALS